MSSSIWSCLKSAVRLRRTASLLIACKLGCHAEYNSTQALHALMRPVPTSMGSFCGSLQATIQRAAMLCFAHARPEVPRHPSQRRLHRSL